MKRFNIRLALEQENDTVLEIDKAIDADNNLNAGSPEESADAAVQLQELNDSSTQDASTPADDSQASDQQTADTATPEQPVETVENIEPTDDTEASTDTKETQATDSVDNSEKGSDEAVVQDGSLEEQTQATEDVALAEVIEPVDGYEDHQNSVSDALNTVIQLENLIATINTTDAIEEGLDPSSIQIVATVLGNAAKSQGVDPSECMTPGLESFKSFSGRKAHTGLVLESITEFVGRIWKAIVNAVRSSIAWIKSAVENFGKFYQGKQSSIKSLIASLDKVDNPSVKMEPYENELVISKLHYQTGGLTKGIEALTQLNKDFSGDCKQDVKEVVTDLTNSIKKFNDGLTDQAITLDTKISTPTDFIFIVGNVKGYEPTDDSLESFVYRKQLPGALEAVVYLPKSQASTHLGAAKTIRGSRFLLASSDNSKVESIDFLAKADLKQYLQSVDKLCSVGVTTLDVYKQFINEKEQLAKVIQLYMSEQQKQASKNLSDSSKDATTPESFEKQDSKSRFATDVLAHIQMVDGLYVMGLSKINRLSQTVVTAAIEFSSSNIKFLAKPV